MPANSLPNSLANALPNTLDEVVARLTAIVEHSSKTHSRLGYFAALYRLVTLKVQAGIAAEHFQDGVRMEQFDVIFANRYLAAYEAYQQGQPVSACWRVAFEAAEAWPPIILQQLLLGMNAHINLDLGIAAATVAPGAALSGLQHDFNKINALLAGLVTYVQAEIGSVSPWCWLLDHLGGRTDEALVNFSIDLARARLACGPATRATAPGAVARRTGAAGPPRSGTGPPDPASTGLGLTHRPAGHSVARA